MNQRKIGVILSYLYIVLNSIIGIFFTPFILSKLGNSEYGLYQLVQSVSSYLVIANCGTGTAMTKFVTQFRTQNDKKQEENYIVHNLFVAAVSMLIILAVGFVMMISLPRIFTNFTAAELSKARVLFVFLVLNIMLSSVTNAFAGYAVAYEQFLFTNGWGTFRIILRVLSIVVLLNLGFDSIAIVLTDFFINALYLLTLLTFCRMKLQMTIHFHYIDWHLLKSTFVFSIAILIQAIVNQVNQNVDKMVLGIMCTTLEVTVYSIAMNIFVMFSQLPSALGSVFLPKITRMVYSNCSNDELVDLSAKVGRIQFLIVGAALSGFILFGQNFMYCWVGKHIGAETETAWLIALIIMVPTVITSSNGVCASILDAKEKRIIGSSVLAIVAAINIVLTVLFIKQIGIIGAPMATSVATIVGSIFILNWYFIAKLKINTLKMYMMIFRGLLPSLVLTSCACYFVTRHWSYGWHTFSLEVVCFCTIYSTSLLLFGLNNEEKNIILGKIKRKN